MPRPWQTEVTHTARRAFDYPPSGPPRPKAGLARRHIPSQGWLLVPSGVTAVAGHEVHRAFHRRTQLRWYASRSTPARPPAALSGRTFYLQRNEAKPLWFVQVDSDHAAPAIVASATLTKGIRRHPSFLPSYTLRSR